MKVKKHILKCVKTVEWFEGRMLEKLVRPKNLQKRHWSEDDNLDLLERVREELEEVQAAYKNLEAHFSSLGSEEVIDECADVANMIMMVADNIRSRNL